ncbi:MAG: hypothetical protein ACLU6B_03310 [Lachnospirales bacterium]
MRNKLGALLLLSGFLILAGLAGSEDLALSLGEAGRDLSDLIILGLLGVSMMTAGIIGINRKER